MSLTQKRIFALLLFMALAAFILLALPNAVASQNISMVQIFQPDEAAPLPYIFRMIAPASSLNLTLRQFVFYDYYYYGFPFFAASALLLLPLQLLGRLADIPLVMLVLRQFVSVLPMLAALLILVYMQDGFRTYRSPVLFAFLLAVPAVVENNSWYHPDGITFLLVVLTIFFLKRDDLRIGRNFLLAALMCGVATATKLVGVYFFLAVGLVLVLSLVLKKVSWKKVVGMAFAFIITMALAYLAANPFLLSHWARTSYQYILYKQGGLLAGGYGVVYAKGLAVSWPLVRKSFGEAPFLLIALGTAIWGAWRGPQRLLHGLILAWFVPISVTVFFLTHFKFQYWLPAALPLSSSLVMLLPEKWNARGSTRLVQIVRAAILLVLCAQFVLFVRADIVTYESHLHRAEDNTSIQFYDKVLAALKPLPDAKLHVYYDYRIYDPGEPGWMTETNFDLLEYAYIQEKDFDVLLLLEQRIRDYLDPEATGIDPALFARSQQFYRDADNGTIKGYHLVQRDTFGLVYVRDDLYQAYYLK
jgi:hypothetical protein